MELLKRLKTYSEDNAENIAFKNAYTEESITYAQLWSDSNKIADHIDATVEDNKKPIVVYGHKSPLMLAAFLACVKTGHPYCPVDISMPKDRLSDIVDASETKLLIAMEDTEVSCDNKFTYDDIKEFVQDDNEVEISEDRFVSGRDRKSVV